MLMFQTERLIAKSHMTLEEGLLRSGVVANKNIIDIFSNDFEKRVDTQMRDSFVFYDKDNMDVPICYISYHKKRDRYELHWETLKPYREHGYMSEALIAFEKWMGIYTADRVLWAMISNGNIPSIRTAEKCGFEKTDEHIVESYWYRFTVTSELHYKKEGV